MRGQDPTVTVQEGQLRGARLPPKFYAAKALGDIVDRAVQVHGALGLTERSPLSMMYALARGGRIYDGPDEVHQMVVSRRVLRDVGRQGSWRPG